MLDLTLGVPYHPYQTSLYTHQTGHTAMTTLNLNQPVTSLVDNVTLSALERHKYLNGNSEYTVVWDGIIGTLQIGYSPFSNVFIYLQYNCEPVCEHLDTIEDLAKFVWRVLSINNLFSHSEDVTNVIMDCTVSYLESAYLDSLTFEQVTKHIDKYIENQG